MPSTPGAIWKVHEHRGAVLHLRGDIDDIGLLDREADTRTSGAKGGHRSLVIAVQASTVTFMDAAGLPSMFWEIAPLVATGRRSVLRRPSRPVRRILELTDLGDVFVWQ